MTVLSDYTWEHEEAAFGNLIRNSGRSLFTIGIIIQSSKQVDRNKGRPRPMWENSLKRDLSRATVD